MNNKTQIALLLALFVASIDCPTGVQWQSWYHKSPKEFRAKDI
jgi:hypothetical protein